MDKPGNEMERYVRLCEKLEKTDGIYIYETPVFDGDGVLLTWISRVMFNGIEISYNAAKRRVDAIKNSVVAAYNFLGRSFGASTAYTPFPEYAN